MNPRLTSVRVAALCVASATGAAALVCGIARRPDARAIVTDGALMTAPSASNPSAERVSALCDTATPPDATLDLPKGLADRMKAIDALGGDQPAEVLAEVRAVLLDRGEDEAVRNSAANRLRERGNARLVGDLTKMMRDPKESPKWRNYCVQHLYTCWEEAGAASRDGATDDAIIKTLFEAAASEETLVRICAVWSLARAATCRDVKNRPDAETTARIRAEAMSALRDAGGGFLVREAGIQSCARLGLKEALAEVRALAADDATKPTHLRVVAIAALGDLGDCTDLALLHVVSASASGQLRAAADLAARKIEAKRPER